MLHKQIHKLEKTSRKNENMNSRKNGFKKEMTLTRRLKTQNYKLIKN